jgi:hypothetical protein
LPTGPLRKQASPPRRRVQSYNGLPMAFILESEMSDRLEALERRVTEVEEKFVHAFPAGDHEGHRRYHELMIEDIASRKRLRQAVMEKTIAGLVWGTIAGLAIAAWAYLKALIRGGA